MKHFVQDNSIAVSDRGADRWRRGHPWIYRSDVVERSKNPAGVVTVRDRRGRAIGSGLWSPSSEISVRMLDRDPAPSLDLAWWRSRLDASIARRAPLRDEATGHRLVHGEADALPSLVVDRYDRWLVVQLLSAGLDAFRDEIIAALVELLHPEGILARNDVAVRTKEHLSAGVQLLHGSVPEEIEIMEHGVRYLAAPWTGQKTGAFLDQRENRFLIGEHATGRALDCFSYHGSFALHLARRAASVVALDISSAALDRARLNAERNGLGNIIPIEADAFEFLKNAERARERFETIVLDPPAFAKNRASLPAAIRGYKEINLRAMRIVTPGGLLFTASCSFHLSKAGFLTMLHDAAEDSGRRVVLRAMTGQPLDHPEVLSIPETGYLKGALLEVHDR